MPDRASIAIACSNPSEQAKVAAWLNQSGYHPVTVSDLSRLDEVLQTNAVEALVADLALLPREGDVWGLLRRLGINRPLVVIGDTKRLPSTLASDLTVIDRPVTSEGVTIAVGLALAEGRPTRRFPRRQIEPVRGSAHGVSVIVREASAGGVGLDLVGPRPAVLPPFFRLRLPEAGVHVVVKRAWMTPMNGSVMRCGGTVEGDLPDATRPWSEFAREARSPFAAVGRRFSVQ
jgi:hypothetical protein